MGVWGRHYHNSRDREILQRMKRCIEISGEHKKRVLTFYCQALVAMATLIPGEDRTALLGRLWRSQRCLLEALKALSFKMECPPT